MGKAAWSILDGHDACMVWCPYVMQSIIVFYVGMGIARHSAFCFSGVIC